MGYQVEPTFAVRVAGLPHAVLTELRTGRTAGLVDRVLDVDDWLDERRESLSEALHGLIGGNEDVGQRRRLILVRRDVYHARLPRPGVVDAALLDGLPAGIAGLMRMWHQRIEERESLLAAAAEALDCESVRVRRDLYRIAADGRFQQGLVLASQDLFADLAKRSAGEPEPRMERKLAKYLSRMAAKTSPFSTFTGTRQGRFRPGAPDRPEGFHSGWRGVAELNTFTLQQIARALTGWPEIRPGLPLEVNGSVVEDGDTLRFLGRRDGGEAVVEIAASPTVRHFLELVRHSEDRTHAGVVGAVARQAGRDRAPEIARFLDRLVEVGLVEISFGVDDHDTDPLGRLITALGGFPDPRVAAVRTLLGRVRAELGDYGRPEAPAERLDRVRRITAGLRELYCHLGWDSDGPEFPRHVFYEDVLLTGWRPEWNPQPWQGVLDGLDLLRRLAGLYDRFLPGRIAAETFAADHYGPRAQIGFVDFYRDFCAETSRPAGWRDDHRISGADLVTCYEQAFPVPVRDLDQRLADLARWQTELVELVAATPVDDDGCRRLRPAELAAFLDRLPSFVTPIESMACYVQPMTGADGGPLGVLNELMTGSGRGQARLARLDYRVGAGAFPAQVRAGNPELAEITGTVGSNLNLRRPVTRYEISYPGTVSERPPEQRITLADLHVVHDPEQGALRLVAKSHGVDIRPVHLGVMVEFLLPAAHRFLLQMFGQAVPRFEFLKQMATASPVSEADDVVRHPRLLLGDLVVNRASWMVPARHVPQPVRGGSPLDHLIELNRWRRRHGLPRQVFVRAMTRYGNASQRSRAEGMFDKTRKPLYLDFSSEVLLRVFGELVAGTQQMLVFEEMLPTESDLTIRDDDGAYAGEFVVELNEDRRDE
ncbi:MAG TPA: lantibiotic dehydratase [Actinoplanes sp.]|nr:lantibiotic dehydratase [Actinoplanes sp.]